LSPPANKKIKMGRQLFEIGGLRQLSEGDCHKKKNQMKETYRNL